MRKEDISRMAIQAGLGIKVSPNEIKIEKFKELSAFATLVASYAQGEEREACIKLCKEAPEPDGADLAERIKARWQA
jgi:hypothetical protein